MVQGTSNSWFLLLVSASGFCFWFAFRQPQTPGLGRGLAGTRSAAQIDADVAGFVHWQVAADSAGGDGKA
ncbi:hypothetical protein TRIATDRAFT_304684 [Trichoderma atroviride IMI 206040]|uniref:Uncharacterized protein n=1 Tax=Hypocrea atroviridis (strain ATCC 20476 / IMI 206040) TaxID=452589 RepID=G9NIT2_HYPAI|nr:uncharacterized protein TRIATDRAFT_304684 [Trichoderma atroviride IMI 206040]EHK49692.1 hypothetical protein TRIATDRAFT_304684 [Trichoderma atroviride IMI 206040]